MSHTIVWQNRHTRENGYPQHKPDRVTRKIAGTLLRRFPILQKPPPCPPGLRQSVTRLYYSRDGKRSQMISEGSNTARIIDSIQPSIDPVSKRHRLKIAANSAFNAGVPVARGWGRDKSKASPDRSETVPPASVTSSTPAAISQAEVPVAQ